MEQFGRVIKGFDDGNALIEGIESRTSSPVRILRDEAFQSGIRGLFPCGEGAGYGRGNYFRGHGRNTGSRRPSPWQFWDDRTAADETAYSKYRKTKRRSYGGHSMGKQAIRSKYLAYRDSLTTSERLSKSMRIWKNLKREREFQEAELVLVYLDYRSEVMTTGLVEEIFCPRAEGECLRPRWRGLILNSMKSIPWMI